MSKWVSIKEKEPDKADHVLLTVKWAEDDYEVTEFDWGVARHYPTSLEQTIMEHTIAWMPMPKPYKEKEEVTA